MKNFIKVKQCIYREDRHITYTKKVFTGNYEDVYINVDDIVSFKDGSILTKNNTFENLDITAKDIEKMIKNAVNRKNVNIFLIR